MKYDVRNCLPLLYRIVSLLLLNILGFSIFQNLYIKEAATSLPISSEPVITTTDQNPPLNSWANPVTEKNAATLEISNALKPNK